MSDAAVAVVEKSLDLTQSVNMSDTASGGETLQGFGEDDVATHKNSTARRDYR